jgi:Rieske Fe-S protein
MARKISQTTKEITAKKTRQAASLAKLSVKESAKKSEKEVAKKSEKKVTRKGFMRTIFATGGLVLGYGTLGWMVLRYLWPYKKEIRQRIFVSTIDKVPPGHTVTFSTPNGESYLLSNIEVDGESVYLAYSNRCPHLGCKVIWEKDNNRFFCPCHHGVFNTQGIATDGPPAKAKQRLKKCEIEIVDKSIYAVIGSSV